MPPPYSDNLYSMYDDDDEEQQGLVEDPSLRQGQGQGQAAQTIITSTRQERDDDEDDDDADVLSPSDGYFSNGSETSRSTRVVEDPSLPRGSTGESKARELEEERNRLNTQSSLAVDESSSSSSDTVTSAEQQQSAAPEREAAYPYYHHPQQHSSVTRSPFTGLVHTYTPHPQEELPPPPAYTPSSEARTSPTIGSERNYNTFSGGPVPVDMGRRSVEEQQQGERRRLLEGGAGETVRERRDPESMRDLREGRRSKRQKLWEKWKNTFVGILFVVVTCGLFVGLFGANEESSHTSPRPPSMEYPEVDKSIISWPSKNLCKSNKISRPTQTFDLSFDSHKPLSIIQTVTDDHNNRYNYRHIHVQGEVIFRRADDKNSPSLVVDITVNDERIQVPTEWDSSSQYLKIKTPNQIQWDDQYNSPGPCIHVKATVWAPSDDSSAVEFLEVNTVHLDIKLLDNLSLRVSKATKLSSTVGTIVSASTGSDSRDKNLVRVGPAPESFSFDSKYIEVKTTAADIYGAWPLYDGLSLQSTSGDIKVFVEPKEGKKEAALMIKSMSGDVEFREPIEDAQVAYRMEKALKDAGYGVAPSLLVNNRRPALEEVLPVRDYRVEVVTSSGNIDGWGGVAFGNGGVGIKSTSGDVRVRLLPVFKEGEEKKEIRVVTGSTSGDTEVEVLGVMWWSDGEGEENSLGRGEKKVVQWPGYLLPVVPSLSGGVEKVDEGEKKRVLGSLYGSHSTTSGDIKVKYPGEWEGDIHMATMSGSLKIGGEGVRVIKSGNEWPGVRKKIDARKGEGEGKGGVIKVVSNSGNNEVFIGGK
ncbi:hypothetical protein QBC38DRAFT_102897 [Podospora fimiseda]|uniref:Adhesin domain-containing protein n=1 Tax=Podospora fimiseda TaxID=252190 RepID=A0AAN6YMP0_9PEZI|nr:hypothetical protein QBC38DRAFT_102897 [Podospora fimiseda]